MKIEAHDLAFGYEQSRILEGVSLGLREGALLGLVGPNGAGKSTLLRCLHGALRPQRGTICIDGTDIAHLRPREIARRVAVVPQSCTPGFAMRVDQFVGLGRYAHERFFGGPTPHDLSVVDRCLEELDLGFLRARLIDELSGGEFRRVLIARALAQETDILLFDEPIQQLDLKHQLEVMEFARAFASRPSCASIVVLHELGLAARYCDELVLLHEGRVLAQGQPEQVLTHATLREAYGIHAAIDRVPATGTLQVVPLAVSEGIAANA